MNCYLCIAARAEEGRGDDSPVEGCQTCGGTGLVEPGDAKPADKVLIDRYARLQWRRMVKLLKSRSLEPPGKKERESFRIEQGDALWKDFKQMPADEQEAYRLVMRREIEDA